jgi:hypothetical protein
VPVFSFGENNLFYQLPNPEGSSLRKLQHILKKITAIGFPVWWGKGVLCSYGFLPLAKPVNTVVGKPIKVKQNVSPTEQDINEMHKFYISKLIDLFDEHKDKYCEKPTSLEII